MGAILLDEKNIDNLIGNKEGLIGLLDMEKKKEGKYLRKMLA